MHQALNKRFPPFVDEQCLKSAIVSLCADFGKVTRLHILPARRGPGLQCACFLRLDTTAAEQGLRSRFHVIDFAGDIHFFADVSERWIGPTM